MWGRSSPASFLLTKKSAIANSVGVKIPVFWTSAKSQIDAKSCWPNLEVIKKVATWSGLNWPECDLSRLLKMESYCAFMVGVTTQSEPCVDAEGWSEPEGARLSWRTVVCCELTDA